jgi:hypothetical protein
LDWFYRCFDLKSFGGRPEGQTLASRMAKNLIHYGTDRGLLAQKKQLLAQIVRIEYCIRSANARYARNLTLEIFTPKIRRPYAADL